MSYHDTDDVVEALRDVERAVKDRWSPLSGLIFVVIVIWLVSSLLGEIWHSKWRYALAYSVPSDQVQYQSKPHDCDFLAAPLGDKYCHYDVVVSTIEWATSATGNPIVSSDGGKTWSVFTPDAGKIVPQYPTVEFVDISWEKKEE